MRGFLYLAAIFVSTFAVADPAAAQWTFVRGDVSLDGYLDIEDAIGGLEVVFGVVGSDCLDAVDANDDGVLDLTDPLHTLSHLFLEGASPAAPFPECGLDSTPDGLGCSGPLVLCSFPNGVGPLFPGPNYSSGHQPWSAEPADFTGDGILDLWVSNTDMNPGIMIGMGDGTFQSELSVEVGLAVPSNAIGDWNADGHIDVAASGFDPGLGWQLRVLLGNGDATFSDGVSIPVPQLLRSITASDFDGDGLVDLAAVDQALGLIRVFAGLGDGAFVESSELGQGIEPTSIAVGEFNGDGILDLLATSHATGELSVLFGDGLGAFDFSYSFPLEVFDSPSPICVGDFDGDLAMDFAVALAGFGLHVYLGDGAGDFVLAQELGLADGALIWSLALGDINEDGIVDLVSAGFVADQIMTLLGVGTGTFELPQALLMGHGVTSAALGDFDGDGSLDIASAVAFRNHVNILIGNGDGTVQSGIRAVPGGNPSRGVTGDFDGDGILDVVLKDGRLLRLALGLGDGTLLPPVDFSTGGTSVNLRAADLNGDGASDLAVVTDTDRLEIFLGTAVGSFLPALGFPIGSSPRSLVLDDFDGDGVFDAATANFGSEDLSIMIGNGDGTFSGQSVALGFPPTDLAAGDVDGDGAVDLVVSDGEQLSLLRGDGGGAFSTAQGIGAGSSQVQLADSNDDGTLDIYSGRVRLGNGDGTFSAGTGPPIYGQFVIADFNDDGVADIARPGQAVTVRFGVSDGTFLDPLEFGSAGVGLSGVGPNGVLVGDFDGDGKPDVAALNRGLIIMLNQW